MTPPERHAEALADLDRQTYLLHDHEGLLKSSLVDLPADQSAAVCTALNSIVRAWEGRRSILRRHAPDPEFDGPACSHDGCFAIGASWPCPDYRDAAAGLPEDPDG